MEARRDYLKKKGGATAPKKIKKPIDKSKNLCYNINTIKEGCANYDVHSN